MRKFLIFTALIISLLSALPAAAFNSNNGSFLGVPEKADGDKPTPQEFIDSIAAYRSKKYGTALSSWKILAEQDYGPALCNLGVADRATTLQRNSSKQ